MGAGSSGPFLLLWSVTFLCALAQPTIRDQGCSSFPGTADKCHHQKLKVGLFFHLNNSMILSPLKLVWLWGLHHPQHPSQEPQPISLGSQPEERQGRWGWGWRDPHIEQEHHLGLAHSEQQWLWNLLLFLSRKFSPSCQSPSPAFFFEVGELRAWITSLININIAKHK